ncbi:MAG TPA: Crp/Fnr family transcriptional regulator [Pricia sp.]|nr:Crp/Fnr family transcriptional regulator [Pricia sp.]
MEELFKYFEKFLLLSEESKKSIREICSFASIPKNQELQPIGHTCRTVYFIKKGIARIYYYKEDIDITEYFAFENNIIARAESLFTGKPSKKGIQVLEDSQIIAINATQLYKLYDDYPQIERVFRLIFEAAYVDAIHRIESIQFCSAKERYLALLHETELVNRIALKHIASYLGVTQVSLSRIRASLN